MANIPNSYVNHIQDYYNVPLLSAFAMQLYTDSISLSSGNMPLSAYEATGLVAMPDNVVDLPTEVIDYIGQINYIKNRIIWSYNLSAKA